MFWLSFGPYRDLGYSFSLYRPPMQLANNKDIPVIIQLHLRKAFVTLNYSEELCVCILQAHEDTMSKTGSTTKSMFQL